MICGKTFNFIHIMKTGGTWMQRAVEHVPARIEWKRAHVPYSELPESDASKPTYAIIRNPWDWHVSMYHFMNEKTRRKSDLNAEQRALYSKSLAEVLMSPPSPARYELHSHLRHMTERQDGKHLQIRWSKFEAGVLPVLVKMLEETGPKLRPEKIRDVTNMNKINTSKHRPYREYYTHNLQQVVGNLEREVVSRFGYQF